MQDRRFMSSSQAQAANIDAGLRSYMLGVYNHMTIGMAITGFFAYLTKIMSVSEGMLTPFGAAIYASPIRTPRGRDVMAACGQLKSLSKKLKKLDRKKTLVT